MGLAGPCWDLWDDGGTGRTMVGLVTGLSAGRWWDWWDDGGTGRTMVGLVTGHY